MSVSERTKERNRIKRQIIKVKESLVESAGLIQDTQGIALVQLTAHGQLLTELATLQADLNALSAPVDEQTILEQSLKRTERNE